jgi:hypothetical protein
MFAGPAQKIERLLDEAIFDFRIPAQFSRESSVPRTQWTSRFPKKQAGRDSRFAPSAPALLNRYCHRPNITVVEDSVKSL